MNDTSSLRVYRAPGRRYWLCRTRWVGEKAVHEHAQMVGRRVKWFRHPVGWQMPMSMALPFDAALVVLSVLSRQSGEKRRSRKKAHG